MSLALSSFDRSSVHAALISMASGSHFLTGFPFCWCNARYLLSLELIQFWGFPGPIDASSRALISTSSCVVASHSSRVRGIGRLAIQAHCRPARSPCLNRSTLPASVLCLSAIASSVSKLAMYPLISLPFISRFSSSAQAFSTSAVSLNCRRKASVNSIQSLSSVGWYAAGCPLTP